MGLQILSGSSARKPQRGYTPPAEVHETTLTAVLAQIGKPPLEAKQHSFLAADQSASDTRLFYAGNLDVLKRPSVAIVGARAVTPDGERRARRLARELSLGGLTIVSGLAKGVDGNAHRATLEAGGRTAAVIGTPLEQAYPAEHKDLQQEIANHHLLITPFAAGSRVFPANFPKRNRVMAALTDGTVIIEASDSSGTLHQAVECERLGRWLFILQSVFDNPDLEWPRKFSTYRRTRVVRTSDDILGVLLP